MSSPNIKMSSKYTGKKIDKTKFKGKGPKCLGYKEGGRIVKLTTPTKNVYWKKSTTTNRIWPTTPTGEEIEGFRKGPMRCWTCGENHL